MFRVSNLRMHSDQSYPELGIRTCYDRAELWRASDGHIEVVGSMVEVDGGINGGWKDQAAAFSAGSDVHVFLICGAGGASLRTITSQNSILAGPTMPDASFTHFCYLTTLKLDGTGNLIPGWLVRSDRVTYAETFHSPAFVINPDRHPPAEPPGHAMTRTAVSVGGAVPAVALEYEALIDCQLVTNVNTAGSSCLCIEIIPGKSFSLSPCFTQGQVVPTLLSASANDYCETIPNLNQTLYYYWEDVDGTANIAERYFSLFIHSYRVPTY